MPLNYLKTALLLGVLTAIFVAMGGFVGGERGLAIAFAVALVTNAFAYWKSDSMVLRMQGAVEVDQRSGGQYYEIVQQLSARAGLPMPRVCVMQSQLPNAFATGRNPEHAAVCASTGLLDMLTPQEVAGVIGHELSHVKSRDTLTMTMAATIGGAISMLANWLQISAIFGNRSGRSRMATFAAMLIAPLAATVIQMSISRSREYQADRAGAMLCGNPAWLASALTKINNAVRRNPAQGGTPSETTTSATSVAMTRAMAHLFIINPLTGRGLDSLFASHPSTENRIAELAKLATELGVAFDLESVKRQQAGSVAQTTIDPNTTGSTAAGRPRGIWG